MQGQSLEREQLNRFSAIFVCLGIGVHGMISRVYLKEWGVGVLSPQVLNSNFGEITLCA
jgi:hypothetical protein